MKKRGQINNASLSSSTSFSSSREICGETIDEHGNSMRFELLWKNVEKTKIYLQQMYAYKWHALIKINRLNALKGTKQIVNNKCKYTYNRMKFVWKFIEQLISIHLEYGYK